eukprot:gene17399-20708_t
MGAFPAANGSDAGRWCPDGKGYGTHLLPPDTNHNYTECRDASNRLKIELADENDDFLFFVHLFENVFQVKRLRTVPDPLYEITDDRWVDYDFGGYTVELHSNHFLGLDIAVAGGGNEEQLRAVAKRIEDWRDNNEIPEDLSAKDFFDI